MRAPLTILVALDRKLVERLIGAEVVREAERRAQGFELELERQAWLAGHIGAHIEAVLR